MAADPITFACARTSRKGRTAKAAGITQQPLAASEWDALTDAQRNTLREWVRRMGLYRGYHFAEAVFNTRSNREAAHRRTCQRLAQLGWLEADAAFVAAQPTSANGPWRLSQRAMDALALDSLDALIAAAPQKPEAAITPETPTPAPGGRQPVSNQCYKTYYGQPAPQGDIWGTCADCGFFVPDGSPCACPCHEGDAFYRSVHHLVEPEMPAAPAPVVVETPAPTQAPTMLSMLERAAFEPSPYQRAIFDWIHTGSGDGIVNAVAGSGKTTTLVQAAHLISDDALFVAFNKHIAEALAAKLAGTRMVAKTIHSVGYGMVASAVGMRLQTDGRKYRKIARDYVTAHERDLLRLAFGLTADKDAEQTIDPEIAAQMYTAEASGTLHLWAEAVCDLLPKLIDFARLTLTDPSDEMALSALMARFDLLTAADVPAIERAAIAWLPAVLEQGAGLAKVQGIIDFTDMIWLPERWNLTPRQVRWVFVDECQDLNAAQLALVLRLRARGGRMLFVGDPRQAIMGFAGADNESFWTIQRRTNAREMPLSICYRCPELHLALAREIVPQIEARPSAPVGVLEHLDENAARALVQPGDMMLCRLTAPLVAECIRLIKTHIPARVRGHDIGKQLADMVKAVVKLQGYHWGEFGQYLSRLEEIQRQKLMQHDASESQLEALADRVDAIRECHTAYDCRDADDLARQIESLFADETNGVMLSTVHRAKGLENARIFILKPEKLPLTWPKQQEWEATQEENIKYVALTRATEALYFVES